MTQWKYKRSIPISDLDRYADSLADVFVTIAGTEFFLFGKQTIDDCEWYMLQMPEEVGTGEYTMMVTEDAISDAYTFDYYTLHDGIVLLLYNGKESLFIVIGDNMWEVEFRNAQYDVTMTAVMCKPYIGNITSAYALQGKGWKFVKQLYAIGNDTDDTKDSSSEQQVIWYEGSNGDIYANNAQDVWMKRYILKERRETNIICTKAPSDVTYITVGPNNEIGGVIDYVTRKRKAKQC